MSRWFQFNITQREVHSWNPFSEEIVETRNQVGVDVRYPGQRLIGRLTSPPGEKPDGKQSEGGGRSRSERLEIKLAAKVEQAHAKALKLSGNRFEVKDRDGHPRGWFPTPQAAAARADEVGGFVFDRLEGLNVYSTRERPDRDAIPDPGVYRPQISEDWELDW